MWGFFKARLFFRMMGLAVLGLYAACSKPVEESYRGPEVPGEATEASEPIFLEQSTETGLRFEHFNGRTGAFYFSEIVGPGGALFDYDRDGDLDIYLVQGREIPFDSSLSEEEMKSDRLFRNDLRIDEDGTRLLGFTDVTSESGIRATGYGMGVAVGDYDNDGWPDFYVTNWGSNQMWRNNGDGTFSDTTVVTATDDPLWSTSAAFFDYDRDGYLDLFITNYVGFTLENHRPCGSDTGRPDYCGPHTYPSTPDRLFRNRGDGSFEDVSAMAGIRSVTGRGLGVVTADVNSDGWVDFYVANDQMPNQLWINQKDGTFRDEALLAGCAVNVEGLVEASMGTDAGDIDNDGDEDLFITHLNGETNTLYLNDGSGGFEDATIGSRLGASSLAYTGWGTAMLDYDNDGDLDLVVANGAVYSIDALAQQGDPYPFHQRNQLFENEGHGVFENVSQNAGPAFELSEISRGVAVGDLDNDGDSDILICNDAGPVRLLVNQLGQERSWIGFRLVERETGRDMLGARVLLHFKDGRSLMRRCRTDASYCSANDPRVLFGLGQDRDIERVTVLWPDGVKESWEQPMPGRYHLLIRGRGVSVGVN